MKMNNPKTQEEDYGISLEQAQVIIAEGDKVFRLMQNQDFKDVIMEGFIQKSALNKVSLLALPDMKEHKESIILELEAISILDSFLRNIQQSAIQTKQSMNEYEEDLRLNAEAPEDEG
jgi:hypothetical protein